MTIRLRGVDLPRKVGVEPFDGVTDENERRALRGIFNALDQNLLEVLVKIEQWLEGT